MAKSKEVKEVPEVPEGRKVLVVWDDFDPKDKNVDLEAYGDTYAKSCKVNQMGYFDGPTHSALIVCEKPEFIHQCTMDFKKSLIFALASVCRARGLCPVRNAELQLPGVLGPQLKQRAKDLISIAAKQEVV